MAQDSPAPMNRGSTPQPLLPMEKLSRSTGEPTRMRTISKLAASILALTKVLWSVRPSAIAQKPALVMELPSELGAALESEPETATELVFVKGATIESTVFQPPSLLVTGSLLLMSTMVRGLRW